MTDKERPEVWVFIQNEDGRLLNVSLEILGKGRELANNLGGTLAAVLLGDIVKKLTRILIHSGADIVYLAENSKLNNYNTLPYTRILSALIKKYKPEILLIGATPEGRDLAPRLASRLNVGLTADCTELKIGKFHDPLQKIFHPAILLQIRPALGGNIIATIVSATTKPQMATVREGVMPLPKINNTR
ncbi:MAG: electron transfer flavoprotein subunit alpha, partial [Thermodesulfobacteriota bacterium]|nr:electron transfer flavoprotein subunit alpha [Thermodesulfobacteriota bacterium]